VEEEEGGGRKGRRSRRGREGESEGREEVLEGAYG